jgi:hypothetical protein
MIINILKLFALILIIAQGLIFVSGVYVLGNREAAITRSPLISADGQMGTPHCEKAKLS